MNKTNINSFENLDYWKADRKSRIYISEIIKKFPDEEKFALAN